MAMAASGSSSSPVGAKRSAGPPARPFPPQMDPRRRQAALSFLSNISLDGRPVLLPEEEEEEKEKEGERERHAVLPSPPPLPQPQDGASDPPLGEQEEQEDDEDAFASPGQAATAGLGLPFPLPPPSSGSCSATPSSRGRLNSFSQGILSPVPSASASFARAAPPQGYGCLEQGQGAPAATAAFELQRSR
ncbi:CDK5 and ABL1 enzyme substrate 1-like [Sceloporus undulatus]|uniref:CDK5 and ABL1 enzyme substrate 1-like n=1 Tax=Sceloporus undulatus TaxID=8520 RepID=UPI001C4D2C19|nr:CDK5 and ABL1 enzyme substrate 1-like [Sceloporus undulatus]